MRVLTLLVILSFAGRLLAAEAFPLRDGDRVALVGNTFIEREQDAGYIELALTLAVPRADVAFRNLGWSGDVVTARARRYFGTTEDGFQHLLEHLDLVKPTAILVSYGTNEAFAGGMGRTEFLEGYGRLLDELQKRTDRIAIITSPPLDPRASPAPEVARRVNEELAWQVDALRELAASRGLAFIDIFTPMHSVFKNDGKDAPGWTTNGMHLTPLGYRLAAAVIRGRAMGTEADRQALVSQANSADESEAEAELRQAIIRKNELFFHRHRPENETYLRGFRKHEQGNNAHEIYEFESLVAEKDQEIFALRQALSSE